MIDFVIIRHMIEIYRTLLKLYCVHVGRDVSFTDRDACTYIFVHYTGIEFSSKSLISVANLEDSRHLHAKQLGPVGWLTGIRKWIRGSGNYRWTYRLRGSDLSQTDVIHRIESKFLRNLQDGAWTVCAELRNQEQPGNPAWRTTWSILQMRGNEGSRRWLC